MLVWGDEVSLGQPVVSDDVWGPGLFAIREVFVGLDVINFLI